MYLPSSIPRGGGGGRSHTAKYLQSAQGSLFCSCIRVGT